MSYMNFFVLVPTVSEIFTFGMLDLISKKYVMVRK